MFTSPGPIAIIVACITAVPGLLAAYVARQAVKNTKPMSNGWSHDVIKRLSRIEGLVVNHLEDHAESDLAKGRKAK